MCGIIGYIGKNVQSALIKNLERLEYRGYDSAGLTVLENGEFYIKKAVGSVENLKRIVDRNSVGMGIAHTRWATHGGICEENCHPHFSATGNVAIVHNGIIENFEELKEHLRGFYGQTDSEVVAKLLDDDLGVEKISDLMRKINGSYALAIISKQNNEMFFAKNKSPLYVAVGKEESLVASDPSCFLDYTDKFYTLEDGDYGYITFGKVEIFNNGQKVVREQSGFTYSYIEEEKQQYEHFMLKEIHESENVLKNIIHRYNPEFLGETMKDININNYNRIYIVGCGTAYHAGLMGAKYIKDRVKIDIFVDKASEFMYNQHILDEKSLCIFVSQSGETADTLAIFKYVQQFGVKSLAVINTEYSTLAHLCDVSLPICAGQEKAVASTKAYLGQCLVFYILACHLAGEDYLTALKEYKINYGDDEEIKSIARLLTNCEKMFYIGRGVDYITSLEASLKLKEITYIYCTAESSGELKHGSLALVEKDLPVIVVANDRDSFVKNVNNAYEVKSRGGKVILVTSLNVDKKTSDNFDYVLKIAPSSADFNRLQTIIVLQKLAYFTAVLRGINPDKPRNLAKSVTVE